MTDEGALNRDQLARVVRRASELAEEMSPRRDPGSIDAAALLAAAHEVGLPIEAVQRSLAIERLGPKPARRVGDRLVGAAVLVVDDEIPGQSDDVMRSLDAWLVDGHHLRRDRLRTDHGEWSKRRGVLGVTVRSIRRVTGEGQLSDAHHVDATVRDVGTGSCVVRVSVDRSHDRWAYASGGAAIGVAGTAAAAAAMSVVAAPVLLIAAPVAIVAGVGVAATGRRRAKRTEREVGLLLDAVGDHVRPIRLRTDIIKRVAGRPHRV